MNAENSGLPNIIWTTGADMYQMIDNGTWGETQEFYKHYNFGISEQKIQNANERYDAIKTINNMIHNEPKQMSEVKRK